MKKQEKLKKEKRIVIARLELISQDLHFLMEMKIKHIREMK